MSVSADTPAACRGTHSAHPGLVDPSVRGCDGVLCALVRRSVAGVIVFVAVASTQAIGAGPASAGTSGSFSVAQTQLEVGASTDVTLTVTTTAGDPLPSRVDVNVIPAGSVTLSSVSSTGQLIDCSFTASTVSCDWQPPAAGDQTGTITFTATGAQEGAATLDASFLPTNNEIPEPLTSAPLNVVQPTTTSSTTTTSTTTTTTTVAPTTTTPGETVPPTIDETTTSPPAPTSSAPATSAATGGVPGTLPSTGSPSDATAALGALVLAVGVLLVGVARLRRR